VVGEKGTKAQLITSIIKKRKFNNVEEE